MREQTTSAPLSREEYREGVFSRDLDRVAGSQQGPIPVSTVASDLQEALIAMNAIEDHLAQIRCRVSGDKLSGSGETRAGDPQASKPSIAHLAGRIRSRTSHLLSTIDDIENALG